MATIDTIANEAYQRHLLKGAEVAPVAVEQKVDSLVKRPPVTEVPEPEVETGKNVIMRFIDALTNDVYDSSILERAQKEPSTEVQMGSDKMYGRYKTPVHVFQAMNRDVDPDSAEMYVRETPSLDYLNMLDIDAREEEMELQEYRRMVAGDSEFSFPTEARQVSSKIKIPKFAESEDPEVIIKDAPDADIVLDEPTQIETEGLGSRPVAEAQTDDDMGITSKPIPTYIVPKTKAEIKETQKSLSDAGYYSAKLAKIDGLKGSNYENAIKSFQYNNDLKVTGEIDEPTSVLLREGESSFVTNPKPSDPLLSFISSGEGGYGAANNGTSSRLKKKGKLFSVYDSYYSDENSKPLQNMTVREILNSQTGNTGLSLQQLKDYMKGNTNKKGGYTAPSKELDNREFFAVGAYQIIPTTMMAAVNSMGLTGEETFTPQLQDKIAKDFLSSKKRPLLNNYLVGTGSVSLEQAMDDIAKEWASLPTSSGGSHYPGQRSAHTIEEAKEILKNSKAKYEAENLGLGV